MKKKIISIISLMLLGTGVSIDTLKNNPSEYKKLDDNVSIIEEKGVEKSKTKVKESEKKKQDEKSTKTVEKEKEVNEKSGNQNAKSSTTTESNNYTNGNTGTSNNKEKTNTNTVENSYTPPVPVQTEWEKLGISEYDYYNSPAKNEGEIAFRDAESVCDSVSANISNKYGLVTHFGDVKSYSENYIGCWITIHLADGSWMFYKEFLAREKLGEFKVQDNY